MFLLVNIVSKWYQLPFRYIIIVVIIPFLAGCSYSPNKEKIENFVNYDSLKVVNRHGNYKASLTKETHLSGTAELIGPFCSAHNFPYDFDFIIDDAITTVLDKVYQTVELSILTSENGTSIENDFSIKIDPADVRIMCHPITEYNWECVATTKLLGSVLDRENDKYDIVVETRGVSPAGGACGGGADAVSASIGHAIEDFSNQLYDILVVN